MKPRLLLPRSKQDICDGRLHRPAGRTGQSPRRQKKKVRLVGLDGKTLTRGSVRKRKVVPPRRALSVITPVSPIILVTRGPYGTVRFHIRGFVNTGLRSRTSPARQTAVVPVTAAPTISNFSPGSGTENGGTSGTGTGTGFDDSLTVTIGGDPVDNLVRIGSSQFTCDTPAGIVGAADVVVETNAGTDTLEDGFTYVAADTDQPQDPGSGYLSYDDFSNYSTLALRHNARYGGPTSAGGSRGFFARLDDTLSRYGIVSPGYNGSAFCLRANYPNASGAMTSGWDNWRNAPSDSQLSNTDSMVVSHVIRVSDGWNPDQGGCKWMEFWLAGQPGRIQSGLIDGGNDPDFCVNWSTNPLGGAASTVHSFQPEGTPRFNDFNDGQWHLWTWQMKPASALGATDGIFAMWVDFQKILDVSTRGMNDGFCTSAARGYLPNVRSNYQRGPDVVNTGNHSGAPGTVDWGLFKWWVE